MKDHNSRIPPYQNGKVRLLIVEDDDLQAQLLASALKAAGFEVDTVSGGLVTVWTVREGRYDVVLVDYRLPEIDGRAIANLVVDFMGDAARPILIALTATPENLNARESGVDRAFDVVLGKPADFSSLVAIINSRLASAPDRAKRQQDESLLLLKDWSDYDAKPLRPEGQHDDSGPARILVVEDDEFQQHFLLSLLERRGYIVEASFNGLDAVRKIRQRGYDLVLVDYSLPEMNGLTAARLIRDLMQEAIRPRLIALTASSGPLKDMEGVVLSAFDEIVQKSGDWQGLLSAVDFHLRASPNPDTRRAAAYEEHGPYFSALR
jgi:two-component system, sensor histidine kinase and response regulator